jgi:Glycosyltransferase family 87
MAVPSGQPVTSLVGRWQTFVQRWPTLPGLRVLARLNPRFARTLVAFFLLAVAILIVVQRPDSPFRPSGDTWAYAAAGERLNAGHELYSIGPDDRPVELVPPYWTIPLVSPPPIAVFWRPLAAIGPLAWILWWLGGLMSCLALVAWILIRGSPLAILGLILASPALTQAAISGNANAYLIPLFFVAWRFRDRAWVVGLILAAAAAIKLSPILFGLWLLRSRRFTAIAAATVAGVAILVGSIAGAGLAAWSSWLAAAPKDAPAPSSLSGLTGLSTLEIAVLVLVICVAILLATRSDGLWFAVCVVGAVLATPALYVASYALLIAVVAPLMGDARPRAMRTDPDPVAIPLAT